MKINKPINFESMLLKNRRIYHFDWAILFQIFLDNNELLVEKEENIEILRQYIKESKVTLRVIDGNSFVGELKRSFYLHLTILERLGINDISNVGNDKDFPIGYNFQFTEQEYCEEYEKWIENKIYVNEEFRKEFNFVTRKQ
jgi:hypothetical protein